MESKRRSDWYNTKEGVEGALCSLESFNELIDERREAGYNRHEELTEFLVLDGKYRLDNCGNALKYLGNDTFSFNPEIPRPKIKCKQCGEDWTIENIDDIVIWRNSKVFSLESFVGKKLADVEEHYNKLTDALYRTQPDILIRNDENIDLSPKYPNSETDWKKGIVKNESGWLSAEDGITSNYVIKKGDELFLNVLTYFHKSCNKKNRESVFQTKFKEIFENAGFENVEMHSTENQYCRCERCAPWFNVETEYGIIQIGWRKRVINIDWSNLNLDPDVDIGCLFNNEDVTKLNNGIHAWGWDKAQDYLTRIHKELKK